MTATTEIVNYLNQLLQPHLFRDYCPNGLQVQGCSEIKSIVSGVSVNQALLDAAAEVQADTVLVHHGFFWKGEDPCLVGVKRERFAKVLNNNFNLIAYHLPLDAHTEFGNNVELAKLLSLEIDAEFLHDVGPAIGRFGHLTSPKSGEQFTEVIQQSLGRKPLYIPGNTKKITKVAWCTGAAHDYFEQAVALGIDAYITGEIAERTYSIAQESGVHFYAAGHHATERYGIKALGNHLANHFGLQHQFIDIDNPI